MLTPSHPSYTQNKFNLLREESEGFAKVLCLLHTGISQDQLQSSKADLLALIGKTDRIFISSNPSQTPTQPVTGFFDLDPNRVLDLVLDVYERHPRNDCFAELLRDFKQESLPHVLGFKFQFYKSHCHALTFEI